MELHLHLSVAFRALDRKWGKPVDLDTSEDLSTCLPAVIERPTTTFSSEEYLKINRRLTPYSRYEERRRRKENVKTNDSFSLDISSDRIPSVTDLEELSSLSGCSSSETLGYSEDEDIPFSAYVDELERKAGSTVTIDSGLEIRKSKGVFKQLKETAKTFVDRRCKRKV